MNYTQKRAQAFKEGLSLVLSIHVYQGSLSIKVSGSKWPSAILLFWYTIIAYVRTCRLEHASKSVFSLSG